MRFGICLALVVPLLVPGCKSAQPRGDPGKKPTIVSPYVPTPRNVVDEMLKLAEVKQRDVVYDLGCGDGRIVIAAVKKFGAKRGVGIDLIEDRVDDSNRNAEEAGVADKVVFRQGDVLEITDLSDADVVTLYLVPRMNRRLKPMLRETLKPGARVVSHDFDMGDDWKPEKEIEVEVEGGRTHTIYLWRMPEIVESLPADQGDGLP